MEFGFGRRMRIIQSLTLGVRDNVPPHWDRDVKSRCSSLHGMISIPGRTIGVNKHDQDIRLYIGALDRSSIISIPFRRYICNSTYLYIQVPVISFLEHMPH